MSGNLKTPESLSVPPKLSSDVADNPLLKYTSYTYNIDLTLMPSDERTLKQVDRSYNQSRGIKIIDSAAVGSVVTESLEITTSNPGHTQAFYMSSLDHRFKMTLVEPIGGRLPAMIGAAAQSFNYRNSAEALFLLEVTFKGYENDLPVTCVDYNGNEMLYKWYVIITKLDMSIDVKGSTYSLELVANFGASSNTEKLKIEKGVQVDKDNDNSKQNNIQGLITRLESGLNQYQEELVKEGVQAKADTYKFYVCPTLKNHKFDFASKQIPTKKEGWMSAFFTDGNIALAPGVTIQGFVHQMFGTSPELVKYLTNDEFDFKSPNPKTTSFAQNADGSKTDTEKKAIAAQKKNARTLRKLKKSILIVTGSTTQPGDAFDYKRKKEAVDIEIFIGAKALTKDLIHPDETEILDTPASIDDVSERINDYLRHGLIRKAYKWIYTGENTEVINLDLKFNNLWRIPLSMIQDLTAPQAKEETVEEVAARRRKQFYAKQNRNADTVDRIQNEKTNPLRFAEDLIETDVLESQQKEANIYKPQFTPTNTKAFEKASQAEGNRPEYVAKHIFKQLHSQASTGGGDLVNLDFDVLGDPFWLHQVPSGVESPAPVQDDIDFYLNNIGNYQESLKNHLAKTAGVNVDNSIYLEVGLPSADRNEQDLMDLDKEDLITGVYRIFEVVHTFTGGKFTSKLKGTKDQLMGAKAKVAMQKKAETNKKEVSVKYANESKNGKQSNTDNRNRMNRNRGRGT